MLNKILLATHNAHKLEEVKAILAPLDIIVVGGNEIGLTDVDETGKTFEENALIKARAGFQQTGLPTLADDSGLCITALNGAPGTHSARFATAHGGYPAVFNEIQKQIGTHPDRTAYFQCCLAFVTDSGKEHVFTGKVDGSIARQATGTHLFGYDPIFIPDGYAESFGELGNDVKNTLSHRARAMEAFIAFLTQD